MIVRCLRVSFDGGETRKMSKKVINLYLHIYFIDIINILTGASLNASCSNSQTNRHKERKKNSFQEKWSTRILVKYIHMISYSAILFLKKVKRLWNTYKIRKKKEKERKENISQLFAEYTFTARRRNDR